MKLRRKGLQPIKLDLFSTSPLKPLQRKTTNNSSLEHPCSSKITEKDKKETGLSAQISSREEQSARSAIENAETSQFTHNKMLFLEKQIFFLLLLVLYCGFLLAQFEDFPEFEFAQSLVLCLMTVSTVSLAGCLCLRRVVSLQLQIDQKLIYSHYKKSRKSIIIAPLRALWADKRTLLAFSFELTLVLIHPMHLTRGLTVQIQDELYQGFLSYRANSLLAMLMMPKCFILWRTMINMTKYVKPRVKRVCNNNQIDFSLLFSIKCIWKVYPVRSIIITVLLLLTIFSFGFRVTEGKVASLNHLPKNGFQDLPTCFWFSFVTMYSIGYGEYVPTTILGRILASALAVLGVGVNSMLVVSVWEYLQMSNQEEKSLSLVHRLQHRAEMEECAAKAMSQIAALTRLSGVAVAGSDFKQSIAETYREIKENVEIAKECRLKIKNVKHINDGNEMMIHDFSMFRESCLQVSQRQTRIQLFLQQNRPSQKHITSSIREHFRQFLKQTLGLQSKKIFDD